MYRRPKFLEELLEIREQMSRDSFYDADLFAERVRSGKFGTPPNMTETLEEEPENKQIGKVKKNSK